MATKHLRQSAAVCVPSEIYNQTKVMDKWIVGLHAEEIQKIEIDSI